MADRRGEDRRFRSLREYRPTTVATLVILPARNQTVATSRHAACVTARRHSRARLLILRPIESVLVMRNTARDRDWVARTVTITRPVCRNVARSVHREPWNTFPQETARARLAITGADHSEAIWIFRIAGDVTRERVSGSGNQPQRTRRKPQNGKTK